MENQIAKSLENKYIHLSVGGMEVQVKIEHEGIVVDVFKQEEVKATTYRFFHELRIEVKEILSDEELNVKQHEESYLQENK